MAHVSCRSCSPSADASIPPPSYTGVDLAKERTKWRARISLDGRQHHLGTFNNPVDAALAYDAALRSSNADIGRFRRLNFPTPEETSIQADISWEHRRRSNLERYGSVFLKEAASKLAVEQAICDHFEVHWLGEGTLADGICRPKHCTTDEWIGIQVKATSAKHSGAYHFSRTHGYNGLMLVCVALDCMQLWMIPGANISVRGLTISVKGKWDRYRCSPAGALSVLQQAWGGCDSLMRQGEGAWKSPISVRQQIEHLGFTLSKAILEDAGIAISMPFVQYGAVDMILDGLIRVQAKVRTKMSSHVVSSYTVTLHRSSGVGMWRRFASDEFDVLLVQLIRDNWLIGIFFIPMLELSQRGLTASGIPLRGQTCSLNLYPPWSSPTREKARQAKAWQSNYFFPIENGIEEGDKNRLHKLLIAARPHIPMSYDV